MRHVLIASLTIGLAGCSLPYNPSENPNEFGFENDAGSMQGTYNPTGFSKNEVVEQLRSACAPPQLASYQEVVLSDGLMSFAATCQVTSLVDSEILDYRVRRGPTGISVTSTTSGISFP